MQRLSFPLATRRQSLAIVVTALGVAFVRRGTAQAASGSAISRDSWAALERLYAKEPRARSLGAKARAILVFPTITKAGLLLGGQYGEGALIEGNKVTGYYSIAAASFGLQFGAQTFSYALFFMKDAALDYLHKSDGWAFGSGPSVVVLDQGKAASLNTTTLTQDVYAIPFGQSGLMAGIGLEGSKISHLTPG